LSLFLAFFFAGFDFLPFKAYFIICRVSSASILVEIRGSVDASVSTSSVKLVICPSTFTTISKLGSLGALDFNFFTFFWNPD
jgi:hypothetical protein